VLTTETEAMDPFEAPPNGRVAGTLSVVLAVMMLLLSRVADGLRAVVLTETMTPHPGAVSDFAAAAG
jgi:hypothetical protein